MKVYLVGSLHNPYIPLLGSTLRAYGYDVFDDWHGAGPDADKFWQDYETRRGRRYADALRSPHARAIVTLDQDNLIASDIVVLVLPAGKSGHMELGFGVGRGKQTHIVLDPRADPPWDVMYGMADHVWPSPAEFVQYMKESL